MRLNRLIIVFLYALTALLLTAAGQIPPTEASADVQADLSSALAQRLQAPGEAHLLVQDLFTPEVDTAFVAPDGDTAVLWLALRDDSAGFWRPSPGWRWAIAVMTVGRCFYLGTTDGMI